MTTTKNQAIGISLKLTKDKRKNQICKVFELKLHPNTAQTTFLDSIFLEAKYLFNHIIASDDPFNYVIKKTITRQIYIDNTSQLVDHTFQYLGSQLQQSILLRIQANIKTLSSLKKKGHKVGAIDFCKEITSIPLKQFGKTYKIQKDKITNTKKISIQKIPGLLKVYGLHQLYSNKHNLKYDLANATLIKKPSGYYLHITCFENIVQANCNKSPKLEPIGIDMGIKNPLTLSNGIKFEKVSVPETKRLKRYQKKLSRQVKRSKNYIKSIKIIRIEYEKIGNKKNDISNKIMNKLLNHEKVYIQDENLSGWKIKFGKVIHHSILGRLKAKLITKPNVYVVDRYIATTKTCLICDKINNIDLKQRTYRCSCGYEADRDIHAAKNVMRFGIIGNVEKVVDM